MTFEPRSETFSFGDNTFEVWFFASKPEPSVGIPNWTYDIIKVELDGKALSQEFIDTFSDTLEYLLDERREALLGEPPRLDD